MKAVAMYKLETDSCSVQLVTADAGVVELPATDMDAASEVAEFFNRLITALPGLPRVVIPGKR